MDLRPGAADDAVKDRHPSDLGVRVTFRTTPPVGPDSVPDCDFAVPLG